MRNEMIRGFFVSDEGITFLYADETIQSVEDLRLKKREVRIAEAVFLYWRRQKRLESKWRGWPLLTVHPFSPEGRQSSWEQIQVYRGCGGDGL